MSKPALWMTSRRVAEEVQELVGDRGEDRLVGQEGVGQAVDGERALRHRALRVDVGVEGAPGRDVVDELDAADLDRRGRRRPDRCRWSRCRGRSRAWSASGPPAVRAQHAARPSRQGHAGYRRPALRRQRSPRPVSTRKCACRRFSASGICLARIAANFSAVMPGRASTRARCTSAGAVTTTTASQRARRRSRTGAGCRARRPARAPRPRRARKRLALGRAPADARSPRARLQRAASSEHAAAERRAVDDPVRDGARETPPRSSGAAARRVERVHDRIGVVDRHAEAPEHRRGRRLAHADRAGEAEDEGHAPASRCRRRSAARSAGVTVGRHPEPAREARHRLVQQHAEPVDGAKPARARRRRGAASRAARRRCRRRSRRAGSPARSSVERRLAGHAERGRVDEEVGLREQRRAMSSPGRRRDPARREARASSCALAVGAVRDDDALDARARAGPRRRARAAPPAPSTSATSGRASQPDPSACVEVGDEAGDVGVVAVQRGRPRARAC